MAFGTPEQDALRRDLTINSLFYNLNTGAFALPFMVHVLVNVASQLFRLETDSFL